MYNDKKIRVSKYNIIYYIILLAFLFPRGFSEVSNIYKTLMAVWVWIATFMIVVQVFYNVIKVKNSINMKICLFSLYFIANIIITIFNSSKLSGGLQQLIAYPLLIVFLILNIKKRPEKILNDIINIYIVLLTLNLIFTRIFFKNLFHITFLGHVQVIAQIGIMVIFITIIYWMIFEKHKRKLIYILVITTINMFTTDADTAILSAVILIIVGITYKWKLYHLFSLNTIFYLIGMLILNLLMVYMSIFYTNFDFNGRGIIWKEAFAYILQKPISGYGLYGILLHPFWTQWTGEGFNYAHNQIVQILLDGGVLLLLLFIITLFVAFSYSKKKLDARYLVLGNSVVIALNFIMIYDSLTIYCYFFIILAVAYMFPYIVNRKNQCSLYRKRRG